jgi:hypothetical protein
MGNSIRQGVCVRFEMQLITTAVLCAEIGGVHIGEVNTERDTWRRPRPPTRLRVKVDSRPISPSVLYNRWLRPRCPSDVFHHYASATETRLSATVILSRAGDRQVAHRRRPRPARLRVNSAAYR